MQALSSSNRIIVLFLMIINLMHKKTILSLLVWIWLHLYSSIDSINLLVWTLQDQLADCEGIIRLLHSSLEGPGWYKCTTSYTKLELETGLAGTKPRNPSQAQYNYWLSIRNQANSVSYSIVCRKTRKFFVLSLANRLDDREIEAFLSMEQGGEKANTRKAYSTMQAFQGNCPAHNSHYCHLKLGSMDSLKAHPSGNPKPQAQEHSRSHIIGAENHISCHHHKGRNLPTHIA